MSYFHNGHKLTRQQRIFADEYLAGKHVKEAAKIAGYASSTINNAQSILNVPAVQDYLTIYTKQAMEEQAKRDKQVINRLARNIAKLDKVIESSINDYTDIDIDSAKLAMQAIDLQAKIEGHYAPTKTANLNVNISDQEQKSAKELLSKLTKKYKRDY